MSKQLIEEIIDRYEGDSGMLIPMMQDLQTEYGYLPTEDLRGLSRQLDIPMTRIFGVATFYSSFRMAPKGQHDVTLCMGTVCYLKGAPKISEAICSEFNVEPGGTTSDRLFTLQAVNCVGACALAPVMIVDGKYYDGVTVDSALDILQKLPSEEDMLPEESTVPKKAKVPKKAPAAKKVTDKKQVTGTKKAGATKAASGTKRTVKAKTASRSKTTSRSSTTTKSSTKAVKKTKAASKTKAENAKKEKTR